MINWQRVVVNFIGSIMSTTAKSSKFECRGKHRYESKRDVLIDIQIRIADSYGGVVDLRPYKCKYCKSWHMTSNTK